MKMTNLICLFLALSFACSHKDIKPKIKLKRIIQYQYKMGEPQSVGDTIIITKYNSFGLKTETFDKSNKKTYNYSTKWTYSYQNDTLLASGTEYGDDGVIWYKKNIKYNDKGLKSILNIYIGNSDEARPELIAGMKFYYDANNEIKSKKYFGLIDFDEDEYTENYSYNCWIGMTDYDRKVNMENREKKCQADTIRVNFFRDKNKKIELITFSNDSSHTVRYSYDSDNNLISIKHHYWSDTMNLSIDEQFLQQIHRLIHKNHNTNRYYFYKDKKIIRKRIGTDLDFTEENYNEEGKLIEEAKYQNKDEFIWKTKYYYNEKGFIKEAINYNKIEEPISVDKYEYEFY